MARILGVLHRPVSHGVQRNEEATSALTRQTESGDNESVTIGQLCQAEIGKASTHDSQDFDRVSGTENMHWNVRLYEGKALADAISAATQRWMGWTICRQTAKQYGIPRGMPYLTGFDSLRDHRRVAGRLIDTTLTLSYTFFAAQS